MITRTFVCPLFALALTGCSFISSLGGKPGASASAQSRDGEDVIACFSAQLVYISREDKPQVGWTVLGYKTLEGPIACPAEFAIIDEPPTAIHGGGHLLSSNKRDHWSRVEQDRTKPQEVAYISYDYQSYDIVFAEKRAGGETMAVYRPEEWDKSEALGANTAEEMILAGAKPRLGTHNQWIELLGESRDVFETFYQRRDLSARQNERGWHETNVYQCFESIGRSELCEAENYGQMHPASAPDNQLPEAWYCAGYGHLNHPPKGKCHTAGDVNSPYAKCNFSCIDAESACVERTGETAACAQIRIRCLNKC